MLRQTKERNRSNHARLVQLVQPLDFLGTNGVHPIVLVNEVVRENNEEFLANENLSRFLEFFFYLHETVNAPQFREANFPKKKNDLVYSLVKEILESRCQAGEIDPNRYQLEQMVATHGETGVETYNTVLTLGEPMTGPTTVLMVHHDVIASENYDLDIEQDETGHIIKITGPTIQDNTVHLAAVIDMLKRLHIPEKGAIQLVFTDHEENGCLGSEAIVEQLIGMLNTDYSVGLIALESTGELVDQLAIGHRGKFSAEMTALLKPKEDALVTALRFCEGLDLAQKEIYADSTTNESGDDSPLGHTTGGSTYGFISKNQMRAFLDVRTNEILGPSKVEQRFSNFSLANEADRRALFKQGLAALKENRVNLQIETGKISIECQSDFNHPSTFNPENNETVFPVLYVVLQALLVNRMTDEVEIITWGEVTRKNSNPLRAVINGSFSLSQEDLETTLIGFKDNLNGGSLRMMPESEVNFVLEKVVLKPGVMTEDALFVDELLATVNEELDQGQMQQTVMPYMTDIATMFNELRSMGVDVFAFIYGAGDPSLLHSRHESLTTEQIVLLQKRLSILVQNIHKQLLQHCQN